MIIKRALSEDGWRYPNFLKVNREDNDNIFYDTSLLTKPLVNKYSSIKPPRWPIECQFLSGAIQHIYYIPTIPEPFYPVTGREHRPTVCGSTQGVLVYRNPTISLHTFFRSTEMGFIFPTCPLPDENTLQFESRFESGNLEKAFKINDTHYELYLRKDLYTHRFMKWFYFRVSNMKRKLQYRFSIVNLTTENSLYKNGLRPLMYSSKCAQYQRVGWKRCGANIAYYRNQSSDQTATVTYTLTFTVTFPFENDTVYFAYSYPYTYSDLRSYLLNLVSIPEKSQYITVRVLCKTLAGNDLFCVTITSPGYPTYKRRIYKKEKNLEKRAVVITARVHPGETPSSWIMKGFIDYLTGTTTVAKQLRDKFVFVLIPMLNPDGVIIGNSRCSLCGVDLNRYYRNVCPKSHPGIWHTKLLIESMINLYGVVVYCDIHAHSKSQNIFLYGCDDQSLHKRLQEQIFSVMLQKKAPDKVSLDKCKYGINLGKEGTARAVMGMMGIPISFTMEASVGGSRLGIRSGVHFTVKDYEETAQSFCETLHDYYDTEVKKERIRRKIGERIQKENEKNKVVHSKNNAIYVIRQHSNTC